MITEKVLQTAVDSRGQEWKKKGIIKLSKNKLHEEAVKSGPHKCKKIKH